MKYTIKRLIEPITVLTNWQKVFFFFSLLILLFSLFPRFYDIVKFLPHYSIDENEIVEYAIGYFGGDLDQRFYSYGPLLSYLLSFIYWIVSWFAPGSLDDFAQNVFFNNTQLYYIARFLNSLLSIATGIVVFLICRNIWGKNTAFLALPLLIFPFAEILTSFTIRVDTLLGLCFSLSIYFIQKLFKQQKLKYVILSGIFAGMAFATKPIPSFFLLPSVFLTFCFLQMESNRIKNKKVNKFSLVKLFKSIPKVLQDKKLYIFLIVGIVSSYVFFPHAFKNWSADNGFKVQQLSRISYEGAKSGLAGWRLDRYLGSIGQIFVYVSAIGLVYGLFKASKNLIYNKLIVLLLPFIAIIVFSRGPARVYWYVPIVYFLVLGIITLLAEVLKKIHAENLRSLLAFLTIIMLIFYPTKNLIKKSIKYNAKSDYTELHTSFKAEQWVEKNIPTKKTLAMYGYFTSLPRLVDYNINRQAGFGDYFMYYKGGNKYYVEQFKQAHKKYVRNPKNKTYNIIRFINYMNANKKKQTINLRYQNKRFEPYLERFLKRMNTDYLISAYKIDKSWNKHLIKSFTRKEYTFGVEIYVYKIKK